MKQWNLILLIFARITFDTMIFKFRALAAADRAFLRDYEIDENCNLTQLHKLIQTNLGFDENQLTSFFLADDDWNKGLEFTLLDMQNDDGPAAVPMDQIRIGDVLNQRKARLLYVYDLFNEHHLFLELIDITQPQSGVKYPRCCAAVGEPPICLADDSDDFQKHMSLNINELDDFDDSLDDEFNSEFGDDLGDDDFTDLNFNNDGLF